MTHEEYIKTMSELEEEYNKCIKEGNTTEAIRILYELEELQANYDRSQ